MPDRSFAADAALLVARRGLAAKAAIALSLAFLLALVLLSPLAGGGAAAAAGCGDTGPGVPGVPPPSGGGTPIETEQITNARTIDGVAVDAGLSGRATLIALMVAMQESTLRNINFGDRDSLGLFQQRPSQGWGSRAQIMNPAYAASAFFGGPRPPGNPGLVDIADWESMPPGDAGQAVQRSAYPDLYAGHEPFVRELAGRAGIDLDRAGDPKGDTPPTPGPTAGTGAGPAPCLGGGLPGTPPDRDASGRWPPESCSIRPDPSTGRGCLTPRMGALLQQLRSMGHTSVTCWDEHAWNPTSEHPKGRACDITFGAIGRFPNAREKAAGDALATWLTQNAQTWAVYYVIWAGQVWTVQRGTWRRYSGGGIYNPNDPTGGHHDHIHVSVF